MSTRRRTALCLFPLALVLAAGPTPAHAGPNADGTLILHKVELIGCLGDDADNLCDRSVEDDPLLDCSDAVTNIPSPGLFGDLWQAYAAFPSTSSPRLSGIVFGATWDDETVFLADYESCGDFELPNSGWPAPGEGTAVTWATVQTSHLVPVYVFAGYEYYGLDVSFDLAPHPTQGAFFADDSIPSFLDPIADFGRMGFNGNPGYLPCPVAGDPVGACCIDDTCLDLGQVECEDLGGRWLGEDTSCDTDPCEPTPTFNTTWGQIKGTYR